MLGRPDLAIGVWERGHKHAVAAGTAIVAARFALLIALTFGERGEIAQAGGWHARAGELLEGGAAFGRSAAISSSRSACGRWPKATRPARSGCSKRSPRSPSGSAMPRAPRCHASDVGRRSSRWARSSAASRSSIRRWSRSRSVRYRPPTSPDLLRLDRVAPGGLRRRPSPGVDRSAPRVVRVTAGCRPVPWPMPRVPGRAFAAPRPVAGGRGGDRPCP